MTDPDITIRVDAGPFNRPLSLLKHIYVEKGENADWNALKALHYKASETGVGPKFLRCVIDAPGAPKEVIGVIVLTVPKVLDGGRNEVFPHLKPNQTGMDTHTMNVMRIKWINANIRLSSRNVIDTMYRGAGVGYRFRNIAMRMSGYRFIEARSSMSRFNPFYFKAGMRAVKPKNASGMDAGLAMFARNFESPAYDYMAIMEEVKAMPEHVRQVAMRELREFYYRASSMEKSGDKRLEGRERVNNLPLPYLLKQAMQLTFGSTIYAVFQNPDWGRVLPERIALSSFDNQAPTEPLIF